MRDRLAERNGMNIDLKVQYDDYIQKTNSKVSYQEWLEIRASQPVNIIHNYVRTEERSDPGCFGAW